MTKIITCLLDTFSAAHSVVVDLENFGIPASEISLVSKHPESHELADLNVSKNSVAAVEGNDIIPQATIGAVIGGGSGLLASLGLLALPGLGPVVAVGWFAPVLFGAATAGVGNAVLGKVVSGLIHKFNRDHEDADFFVETLGDTGTIVTVRCNEDQVVEVEKIMGTYITNNINIRERDAGVFENFVHHKNETN